MKKKIIALLTLFTCCLAISLMWNHFIYENTTTQNLPPIQSQITNGEYSQNSEQAYLDPALMEQARKIIDEHDTIDETTKQQLYKLNLNDQDIEMLVQIEQAYLDPALMEQARKIIDEHDTIDETTKQQLYKLNLNDQDIEMLVQIKNINKNFETASPTFRIPPLLAAFLLFFIILTGYSIISHFFKH